MRKGKTGVSMTVIRVGAPRRRRRRADPTSPKGVRDAEIRNRRMLREKFGGTRMSPTE